MEMLRMETLEEVVQTIKKEITSDDAEVRSSYLSHFNDEIEKFTNDMGQAFLKWRALDNDVKGDENRACVSALVHTAITLHILSLKLFISGQIVAAGNLMRQVLESIALALLCGGKDLGVLEQFMQDKYWTNNAIRDVTKHAEALGLKEEGVATLAVAQKFYHKYSHPTLLTIVVGISFEEQGLYVGANFDEGKIEAYRKEIAGRVGLAEVFSNIIDAVMANLEKW